MRRRDSDRARWDSWSALAQKVAFLRRAESYPDPTTRVEAIETHMSWVFLTDDSVYKLKKPARLALLNLVTLESRRRNCAAEVSWNRRLAPGVYLGVVPLGVNEKGSFVLGAGADVVDWLVKMRRLPAERMLDRAIATGALERVDVERVAETLAAFYQRAPSVGIGADEYRRRLLGDVRDVVRELVELSPICESRVQSVSRALAGFLRRDEGLLDERVRRGSIVEGHGDLRPEHVCLLASPVVIDCVEFSEELRTVDPADELSFLVIECELLGGRPFIEEILFDTYARATGDVPGRPLVWFYKTYRAFLRAKLTIWHLRDPNVKDPRKWIERAERYVSLAERLVSEWPEPPVRGEEP